MDIYIILLILLAVNVLVLILNVVFWIAVSAWRKTLSLKEGELEKRFNLAVEEANKKANVVMEGAILSAKKIISETEIMVGDIKKEMQSSFIEAKERGLSRLEDDLKEIQSVNKDFWVQMREGLMSEFRKLLENLSGSSDKEMHTFVEEVKKATVLAQTDIEHKLELEYQKAMSELESFRETRKKTIEKDVYELVGKIVEEVLTEGLTINDQEKLIIKAVEKFRNET